jgi:serine/threonine protein kinase
LSDKPERLNERFTLWEKIASGGMADVYRATEYGAKGSSKTIALKKILSQYSNNPEYKNMFIDEGMIGSQLTHPNICQVEPLEEIDDNLYIPMEFIDGKNLRQVINKHKKKYGMKALPVRFAVYVINEVYKGLDYAHLAVSKIGHDSGKPLNIVHRDMSPQNIMLSYQGGVKLIDFGIAKAKILTNETRAGVIKGKYSYMSPEQAGGQTLGPQSDIFSAAIVFWELLTGERLFQAESDLAALKAIQDCDLKDSEPIKKNPEVLPELNRIVMKALTKDLSLRYQSADRIQQDLQKFMNEKFSSYSVRDAKKFLSELFAEEIVNEQKKANELYKNFSFKDSELKKNSSNKRSLQQIEEVFDSSFTHTDIGDTGGVTQTDLSLSEKPSEESLVQESLESAVLEVEGSEKTAVSLNPVEFKVPTMQAENQPLKNWQNTQTTQAGVPIVNQEIPGTIVKSAVKESSVSEILITHNEAPSQREDLKSSPVTAFSDVDIQIQENSAFSEKKLDKSNSLQSNVMLEKTDSNVGDNIQSRHFELESSRRRTPFPTALIAGVLVAVFLTGFLVKWVVSGNVNLFFDKLSDRNPTNRSSPTDPTNNPVKIESPVFQCQVQFETDPPGAFVIGDSFSGSSSAGSILVPCQQVVVLKIEKPGYETFKMSVDMTKKNKVVLPLINLQPSRQGSLTLTVDNNATVQIDDQMFGEIKANVPTEFRIPPGVHKFVFRNDVLGLIMEQRFEIQDRERRIENQIIKLQDIKQPSP